MKRNQTGFTLIEIAIVLVIIGLLLGGVLKGQELINSAKVKNLANDFKNTQTIFYAYQDKYRALPGDDMHAQSHVGVTGTTDGNGNGIIAGAWNSTTAADESFEFWDHVRKSGLSSTGAGLPTNAVGGPLGITGTAPITGLPGTFVVCAGNIPGKLAAQVDTLVDDGNTATGALRAAVSAVTMTAVSISGVDENLYNMCMGS